MYRHPSPAPSTTSVSENDEDDVNKSTFFKPSDSLLLSPHTRWSSRFLSVPSTTDSKSTSSMSNLPPEVLIHILRHLHSPKDLYNSLLVSRRWCECSVELLWHKPAFNNLTTLVKMMRVLGRGDQTFTYARFIRRLNFLFLGPDLCDSLFSRLAQCDRLERLTLVNCNLISDDALSRVLPFCPNLVAIDLTGVVDTSDRAIIGLASAAKRLQGINLGGCKRVTDKGILALATNCPLLRRVKLSGVELVTDEPISALAKFCPLLLEIDLNHCKRITDISIRHIWIHSTHMREMRLSCCEDLTEKAFPSPMKNRTINGNAVCQNPFPAQASYHSDEFPPLVLPRSFDQLRMLDLTGCLNITDDVIEGIVSYSPKIRNLVLSKCGQLTDRTVENICRLGKHLHYLHLGHAVLITDASVRLLARCCTRLRYVDFANCRLLTDMAVFELASLPKLRRIGLVRVHNLTDEAIYSLSGREATLERIHLSYCDQISVEAVHFLLQKLHKLTHLSLTGIPAFLDPRLQKFCRPPPSEFDMSQRATFCVYSGKGVSELRAHLTEVYNGRSEELNPTGDSTEYDEEDGYVEEEAGDADGEAGLEWDDDDDYTHRRSRPLPVQYTPQNRPAFRGRRHTVTVSSGVASLPVMQEVVVLRDQQTFTVTTSTPEHTANPLSSTTAQTNGHTDSSHVTLQRQPRGVGFGQQPLVESSSPTPSDVASNRSTGTNQSNGAGFFRTYQYAAAPSSTRGNGALTPDLEFAEIGHGRGAGYRSADSANASVGSAAHSSATHLAPPMPNGQRSPGRTEMSANAPSSSSHRLVPWPRVYREETTPSPPHSPARSSNDSDGAQREGESSVKRGLMRAGDFATSLIFGRSPSNSH